MKLIQELLRKMLFGIPSPQSASPELNTPEQWQAYWEAQGQPWRREPEINLQRQAELVQKRAIGNDSKQGIYPFKGMKLSRADVEWLLATHENGRGPVNWSDESQRARKGLDLRGADLRQIDLSNLPLARTIGGIPENASLLALITPDEVHKAETYLDDANLMDAHLEGADLRATRLKNAKLAGAYLESADLYGAQLQGANLLGTHMQGTNFISAHLRCANFENAKMQKSILAGASLQHANFTNTHLQKADLLGARLKNANLKQAQLQEAILLRTDLRNASLAMAHLEGADLTEAYLAGADLREAYFDSTTQLRDTIFSDKECGSAMLADAHWNGVNLSVMDWSLVLILGDESKARQRKTPMGAAKESKQFRFDEYRVAARANRQLALTLLSQGLNEDAARLAYHAQVLQRSVFWFQMIKPGAAFKQRIQALGAWLFSWFLFLLAGYGYKPMRSFLVYVLVIVGFTALYLRLDGHLAWYEAVVVSMTAFHGRGFSPSTFSPGDPLSIASAFEAFVGLIIEVTFIATLTQRFFNK